MKLGKLRENEDNMMVTIMLIPSYLKVRVTELQFSLLGVAEREVKRRPWEEKNHSRRDRTNSTHQA